MLFDLSNHTEIETREQKSLVILISCTVEDFQVITTNGIMYNQHISYTPVVLNIKVIQTLHLVLLFTRFLVLVLLSSVKLK